MKDIRKGREDRSLYLRGILPYLFALGCARAWVTLAVAAPALALPAAFDLHDVFDYAFCLISIAVALAARRLLPLNATGRMRAASAALMVAASLGLIAVGIGRVAGPAAIALVAAGAAAGGAGFGLFLLLWAEVLSCISLIRIFLYTTASQLGAVVCVFFCDGLDDLRVACALVILPPVALLCMPPTVSTPGKAMTRSMTSSPRNSISPKRLVMVRALSGRWVCWMRAIRFSMEKARLWRSSVLCSCIRLAVSVRRWISACSFS